MKNTRFWFRFFPSDQRAPTKGAATHYCPNKGIVTIDSAVAAHIAQCVAQGKHPTLSLQGWWSARDGTFTVGMAVPREAPTTKPQSRRQQAPTQSPLEELWQ